MKWREWEKIPSTTNHEECLYLAELVKYIPNNSTIVELGTGLGCTACVLGHTGNKVYSFDSYVESGKYYDWLSTDHPTRAMPWTYEQALKNIESMGILNITLINSGSDNTELVSDKIDFLWIDGGHDYDSVFKDVKNWLPKMKESSIICGHDYDLPEVQKAVKELLPNHYNQGRIWIAQMRPKTNDRKGNLKKFLICGAFRSGTTLLAGTLNLHSEIICTNELGIYNAGKRPDGWLLENNLKNKLEKTNLHKKINIQPTAPYTTDSVFQEINKNSDKKIKWYGDKYPIYTIILNDLVMDKVLCCIRDPREVMESQIRNWYESKISLKERMEKRAIPWARPNIEDCLNESIRGGTWLQYMRAWDAWKNKTNIPWLEIYYNKFLDHAIDVANFLEVDKLEMVRNFNLSFNKKSNRGYGAVFTDLLPEEWKDMMKKYKLPI